MVDVRIGFWNLRRLADGSSSAKSDYIKDAVKRTGSTVMLLCEVCSTAVSSGAYSVNAQNLTYRKKNAAQLCYGCCDESGANLPLARYTPQSTAEYQNMLFRGGNDFTQLVDRGVAHYQLAVGPKQLNIYGFHAPSGTGAGATRALAFLLADLKVSGGANWVLIGDMNVEPDDFSASTNNQFDTEMLSGGTPTYHGTRKDSELDFAFSNIAGCEIQNLRRSARATNGDHDPIYIDCTL